MKSVQAHCVKIQLAEYEFNIGNESQMMSEKEKKKVKRKTSM